MSVEVVNGQAEAGGSGQPNLVCRHCRGAIGSNERALLDDPMRPWVAYHSKCVRSLLGDSLAEETLPVIEEIVGAASKYDKTGRRRAQAQLRELLVVHEARLDDARRIVDRLKAEARALEPATTSTRKPQQTRRVRRI